MGNIKLAIVIMLKSILAFSFYGYSFSAIADTSVAPDLALPHVASHSTSRTDP